MIGAQASVLMGAATFKAPERGRGPETSPAAAGACLQDEPEQSRELSPPASSPA